MYLPTYSFTTVGASTFIFRQLNSKAKIGFDSIIDMLRFLLLSPESISELFLSEDFFPSTSNTKGLEIFAGGTALALQKNSLTGT